MKKLILIALLLSSAPVLATTTYVYTGTNFDSIGDDTPPDGTYTTSMKVTGQFTVAEPLTGAPINFGDLILSYSFSDGRQTLTEANSEVGSAFVVPDENNVFEFWAIAFINRSFGGPETVGEEIRRVVTRTGSDGEDVGSITIQCLALDCPEDFGRFSSPIPGTWSVVPVPAAAWLFGSALGLLGWMKRKAA